MGPSGALCIFHQRSWRFSLCIPHHNLGHHIGTSRWHHFGFHFLIAVSIKLYIGKQTELCRSQLASILSTQRLRECQGFIEKVGEIRSTKVKQRQLNKFNNLLNKKEGK